MDQIKLQDVGIALEALLLACSHLQRHSTGSYRYIRSQHKSFFQSLRLGCVTNHYAKGW